MASTGNRTRDGKSIDDVSVAITGKKYRYLPDDGAEQDHVMHEFERMGGVAQKAFENELGILYESAISLPTGQERRVAQEEEGRKRYGDSEVSR
jgi:hypothetical protein